MREAFGQPVPAADAVHAALLRMDYRRIPLIREAFGQFRWPLADPDDAPVAVVDGRRFSVEEVAERFGVQASPPEGWAGHVEWEG